MRLTNESGQSRKLSRTCSCFSVSNPETNGMMTRSKTRPNLAEGREEERESERLETQRQQRVWDEVPILNRTRDDPFMSAGSDEEDERRLVDFFAPYTQVPLPVTSSESEKEETNQPQGRNATPPCSPNPSRYVSFACAATSPTPPPPADVSKLRMSRNQAPEQESAHLAYRMQRPKLPASRMREQLLGEEAYRCRLDRTRLPTPGQRVRKDR